MTKRERDADDDAAAFAEAVAGARPLSGPRLVTPAAPGPGGPTGGHRRVGTATAATASPRAVALSVEETTEGWTGRAEGVDRRVLRKLRDGTVRVEAEVDLHGLTRVKAAAALERFLSASRASARRCLLIIHGRGLHSGDNGPALRTLVRDALTTGAHADAVLACTSAPPARGGAGATLVYLRR